MSYVGSKPSNNPSNPTSQTFTGNNSLTEFTLNRRVSVPEDLEVFVSNVQQQPTSSYTIEGNGLTLKFSEAPPSGQFYVVYRVDVTPSVLDPNGARTNQANTFTENQTFSGNVDINKLLTVDQDTSNQMVTSFEGLNGRVHIGRYGHIIQQNTGNSTTNFWATATRNSGNFDIAYGTSTTDGVVATSNNIISITTSGEIKIQGNELTLDADGDTSITADTDDQIDIKIGGTDEVTLSSSGIVINEGGNDRDFRIESNGKANMFVVDGGNDNVGIGVSAESAVKFEVDAGSDGAVGISCRSDGGNGNNRRFNLIANASGNGTYGGGLKIETRNDSNIFSEIFEYNAYQQEIFKGNYRTADNQTYSDKKHFYCISENLDFTTTTNNVNQTLTGTTTLPYQMGTPFFVRVYYNGDSALMTTVYGIFDIGYHNHKVQTLMTHNGTGTIDSVTVGSTGSYNSAKLTVTLNPYSSYNANNFSGTIYYGYGVN